MNLEVFETLLPRKFHFNHYYNPSRKRSFSKTLFKPGNLKTPTFRFRVDGKHSENGTFRKRHDNHVISLTEFSSQKKLPVIIAFSNFSSASVDEKHLMCFQNENTVLNSSGVAWTGP